MILHQHISYTECPSMSHLGYVEMEGSEQVFRLKDTSEAHIEFRKIWLLIFRLYYSFSDVGGEGERFSLDLVYL